MSAFPKILAVIRSCKTRRHIEVSERMIELFLKNEWRSVFLKHPMSITYSDTARIQDMGRELYGEASKILELIGSSEQNKGAK